MPVDKRRFRANVYVDLTSAKGFAENELVGRSVRIGPKVVVTILERDSALRNDYARSGYRRTSTGDIEESGASSRRYGGRLWRCPGRRNAAQGRSGRIAGLERSFHKCRAPPVGGRLDARRWFHIDGARPQSGCKERSVVDSLGQKCTFAPRASLRERLTGWQTAKRSSRMCPRGWTGCRGVRGIG